MIACAGGKAANVINNKIKDDTLLWAPVSVSLFPSEWHKRSPYHSHRIALSQSNISLHRRNKNAVKRNK